jgi:hypothetical protein
MRLILHNLTLLQIMLLHPSFRVSLHTPNQLYHHYANINKLNLVNFLMIMTI